MMIDEIYWINFKGVEFHMKKECKNLLYFAQCRLYDASIERNKLKVFILFFCETLPSLLPQRVIGGRIDRDVRDSTRSKILK